MWVSEFRVTTRVPRLLDAQVETAAETEDRTSWSTAVVPPAVTFIQSVMMTTWTPFTTTDNHVKDTDAPSSCTIQ